MDAPAYEPTGLFGLLPWLLYSLPFLLLAWGQWRQKRESKHQGNKVDQIQKTVSTVRDNVQNGHKTLMREDLDGLLAGIKSIRDKQDEHGKSMVRVHRRLDQIAEDLSTERQERIAGDKQYER